MISSVSNLKWRLCDLSIANNRTDKVWGEDSTSMQQWQKGDVRNGRPSSDLRIYCDNDERFKEMDPKDEPKGLPMSKDRSDDEKYYVDSINKIKIKGLPSCHGNTLRTDNRAALASTSGGKSGVLYKEAPFDSFSRVSVTVSCSTPTHAMQEPLRSYAWN